MQVSKNAATSVVASGIQGIIRKFTDVYLAVFVFEQKYTKEQIIEFYVNIPYLGSGSYGVEQASRTYFGKSVSQLTLSEAALIAGLFQAPDAYDPYNHPELAEQRRNTVLNLMHRHGYITEEQRDNAKAIPVESMLVGRSARLSQYISFIDTVVEEVIDRTKTPSNPKGDDPYNVSMKIDTTLDRSRQDVVNDVSNGKSDYKFKNDVAQTAIVVISAKDGSIVAIGGGRNKTTERSLNYATNNRLSIKPNSIL
jgi:penicillin-binding protein 1A